MRCGSVFRAKNTATVAKEIGCGSVFWAKNTATVTKEIGCGSVFQVKNTATATKEIGCGSVFRVKNTATPANDSDLRPRMVIPPRRNVILSLIVSQRLFFSSLHPMAPTTSTTTHINQRIKCTPYIIYLRTKTIAAKKGRRCMLKGVCNTDHKKNIMQKLKVDIAHSFRVCNVCIKTLCRKANLAPSNARAYVKNSARCELEPKI